MFFYFALRWRRLKRGKRGMFVMRRSHHSWWLPHVLYQYRQPTGRHQMVSFVPLKPVHGKILPIHFEGRIQWGDPLPKPKKKDPPDDVPRHDEILVSGLFARVRKAFG